MKRKLDLLETILVSLGVAAAGAIGIIATVAVFLGTDFTKWNNDVVGMIFFLLMLLIWILLMHPGNHRYSERTGKKIQDLG